MRLEACYSGPFIQKINMKPAMTYKNLILITSSDREHKSTILPNLSSFSYFFFTNLQEYGELGQAFRKTTDDMQKSPYLKNQNPLLDANGNGIANEDRDFIAAAVTLPITAPPSPTFLSVPKPSVLDGTTKATFRVRVTSAETVTGTVLPPNFDPLSPSGNYGEFQFKEVQPDVYEGTYEGFCERGTYTVGFNAQNIGREAISVWTEVTVPISCWDVNADKTVDIIDLVLIGKCLGSSPPASKRADVNGDGTVDIQDLLLVSKHFGCLF